MVGNGRRSLPSVSQNSDGHHMRSTTPEKKVLKRQAKGRYSTHVRKCRTNVVYKPLDPDRREIRILHVRRNDNKCDVLDCTLETVSLYSVHRPLYEAISYCWSELPGLGRMRLNGVVIDAPASAIHVIRRFQLESASRALWIDAICINQMDLEERAEQVALMGHVYRNTTSCLIWLGELGSNKESLIKSIKFISKTLYQQVYVGSSGMTEPLTSSFAYDANAVSTLFENGISAQDLISFFESPWFTRLWVLQEAVLSPNAVCYWGSYDILWRDVYQTARWIFKERQRKPSLLADTQRTPRSDSGLMMAGLAWRFTTSPLAQSYKQNMLSLSPIMEVCSYLQVSDDRDRFYGTLGLAICPAERTQYLEWLEVDYARPVHDVIRDATRAAIIQEDSLDVLAYIDRIDENIRHRAQQKIGSWVRPLDISAMGHARRFFQADQICADRPINHSFIYNFANAREGILHLTGYEVSRVAEVLTSDIFDSRDRGAMFGKIVAEATERLKASQQNTLIRQMFAAMTAGRPLRWPKIRSQANWLKFASSFVEFCSYRQNPTSNGSNLMSSFDHQGLLGPIFDQAMLRCTGRRLFLTTDGQIGLGHESIQADDVVSALFGSGYPCLLRPANKRLDTAKWKSKYWSKHTIETVGYRFIGLAYVPGIMKGEAIEAFEAAGVKPDDFRLW